MEISACWKPLCLSSTSSSVLASVGARYLDSVISFSLWVRIRVRVSSSLSLMKVLVLANEGAFKPHTKDSDSGERNLTAIVHQKIFTNFLYFGHFEHYPCSSFACVRGFISKSPNKGLWEILNYTQASWSLLQWFLEALVVERGSLSFFCLAELPWGHCLPILSVKMKHSDLSWPGLVLI